MEDKEENKKGGKGLLELYITFLVSPTPNKALLSRINYRPPQ